ncbi:MAG TPA: alpha/beta hydrolase [Chloroflexota bacterium]|nr:alpha/beta hydrolase [Chloroflexota bacterium]
MNVAVRGEPSEPRAAGGTVLVIPGLNGHPGMLMRAAPILFPEWRALAFSHHVDRAEGGVEGMAQRALQLLDEEQTGPVYVCGESFGGTVALTMARLRPERVAGLILLSTFGWHPSMLARRGASALAVWAFLGRRISNRAYRAGRVASVPTQLGLKFSGELLRTYLERPRAHFDAYRTKAELSLTFDARPWLGTLTCPTFVLTGTWDPVVPASAGRELADHIPNATLHSLPGGHLVHLVQANRVGYLISAWARDLE